MKKNMLFFCRKTIVIVGILLFLLKFNYVHRLLAQTQSNKVITEVGTPVEFGTDTVLVTQLVGLINQNPICKTEISRYNINTCLVQISSLPRVINVSNAFLNSTRQNVYLQCVGFVDGAIALMNYPALPPRLFAKYYADTPPPPGYRFIVNGSEAIRSGDIPIWNHGVAGHIAVALNVFPNGEFMLADGNWCQPECGRIQIRTEGVKKPSLVGWLRKL